MAFRSQQGLDNSSVSIRDFRAFANFLLASQYSSTLNYLSAALSYEAERGSIKNALFERAYNNLRRAVSREIKELGLNPKKARPVRWSMIAALVSLRLRIVSAVAFSLGRRALTLSAVQKRDVTLVVEHMGTAAERVRSLRVDIVRADKRQHHGTIETLCSCGGQESVALRCFPCGILKGMSVESAKAIFPISMEELKAAAEAMGTTPHGFRRGRAICYRWLYETAASEEAAAAILDECCRQQGWASGSQCPFEYSEDFDNWPLEL